MASYSRVEDVEVIDRYRAAPRSPHIAPIHIFDPEKEIADEKRRQLHIDRIAWEAEAAQRRNKGDHGR
jgi:hypothetical protein